MDSEVDARGTLVHVPGATWAVSGFFCKWVLPTPEDLSGAVITWEVENIGATEGLVLLKAYVHSSGATLKWADGGEVGLGPKQLEQITVMPDVPAWAETGYDPRRVEVFGLSMRADSATVDPNGSVPILIRGMRIEPVL
jgi:hypothetical protein